MGGWGELMAAWLDEGTDEGERRGDAGNKREVEGERDEREGGLRKTAHLFKLLTKA